VNSLAKNLRAITRIAKAAILQDLCPESMGVSVPASQSLRALKKGMII
jgi:hypothetical protein